MTRIALTGAAGNVGRELLDAFDDEEVLPFTHSEHDDVDSELLDVTDAEDVYEKLDTVDVVVHLAGASSPDAAVENGIDRVVFASSNHAVGTYNAVEADPESMTIGDARTVDADAPARPDSFYGVSKAACEGLANFYAHVHELDVVNLRIGWCMSAEDLESEAGEDVEPGKRRFARALWLSPRDCRDVHRKAATTDLPETPVTVNAVSRNDDRVHSITETMQRLGYEPRDNSAEVLDG